MATERESAVGPEMGIARHRHCRLTEVAIAIFAQTVKTLWRALLSQDQKLNNPQFAASQETRGKCDAIQQVRQGTGQ
jgi:hypothetical protein